MNKEQIGAGFITATLVVVGAYKLLPKAFGRREPSPLESMLSETDEESEVESASPELVSDDSPAAEEIEEQEIAVVDAVTTTTQETHLVPDLDTAKRRLKQANRNSDGDQSIAEALKANFDAFAAQMTHQTVVSALGDDARLSMRPNRTMITFNAVDKKSKIELYRIDADETSVVGVELRYKDGHRVYKRNVNSILDAMLVLSYRFSRSAEALKNEALETAESS